MPVLSGRDRGATVQTRTAGGGAAPAASGSVARTANVWRPYRRRVTTWVRAPEHGPHGRVSREHEKVTAERSAVKRNGARRRCVVLFGPATIRAMAAVRANTVHVH